MGSRCTRPECCTVPLFETLCGHAEHMDDLRPMTMGILEPSETYSSGKPRQEGQLYSPPTGFRYLVYQRFVYSSDLSQVVVTFVE